MKKFGTLIISDRGLAARSDGAFIKSEMKKDDIVSALYDDEDFDIDAVKAIEALSLKDIKELFEISWGGEWHHSGKFASEVKYYWVSELVEWVSENDWKAHLEKANAPKVVEEKYADGEFAVWGGSQRHPKIIEWVQFKKAPVKGNWVYVGNQRKNIDGNWIRIVNITRGV